MLQYREPCYLNTPARAGIDTLSGFDRNASFFELITTDSRLAPPSYAISDASGLRLLSLLEEEQLQRRILMEEEVVDQQKILLTFLAVPVKSLYIDTIRSVGNPSTTRHSKHMHRRQHDSRVTTLSIPSEDEEDVLKLLESDLSMAKMLRGIWSRYETLTPAQIYKTLSYTTLNPTSEGTEPVGGQCSQTEISQAAGIPPHERMVLAMLLSLCDDWLREAQPLGWRVEAAVKLAALSSLNAQSGLQGILLAPYNLFLAWCAYYKAARLKQRGGYVSQGNCEFSSTTANSDGSSQSASHSQDGLKHGHDSQPQIGVEITRSPHVVDPVFRRFSLVSASALGFGNEPGEMLSADKRSESASQSTKTKCENEPKKLSLVTSGPVSQPQSSSSLLVGMLCYLVYGKDCLEDENILTLFHCAVARALSRTEGTCGIEGASTLRGSEGFTALQRMSLEQERNIANLACLLYDEATQICCDYPATSEAEEQICGGSAQGAYSDDAREACNYKTFMSLLSTVAGIFYPERDSKWAIILLSAILLRRVHLLIMKI